MKHEAFHQIIAQWVDKQNKRRFLIANNLLFPIYFQKSVLPEEIKRLTRLSGPQNFHNVACATIFPWDAWRLRNTLVSHKLTQPRLGGHRSETRHRIGNSNFEKRVSKHYFTGDGARRIMVSIWLIHLNEYLFDYPFCFIKIGKFCYIRAALNNKYYLLITNK